MPISLGTIVVTTDVSGTLVEFPVDLTIDIDTSAGAAKLDVGVQVDLAPLQAKFDAILRSVQLPNDTSGYGSKPVLEHRGGRLIAVGDAARIEARVHAKIWHIEKGVPGGGATVRWEQRCVDLPFGGRVCADVPVKVELPPGDDIKTVLAEDDVDGDIVIALGTRDGRSIEVAPRSVDVRPRGELARFIDSIAGVFNSSIQDLAVNELSELINEGKLRQALPREVQAFNPAIKTAYFMTRQDGALAAHVAFTAELTGEQLRTLIT